MGITSENSLWYKGKGEVFREFKKNTGAILSAVASRNFSAMPGFAIEAFTDVEIESKIKLTEYNQKIMSDAIDRELKALGLENDIALKQAMMAWELEKMQLFSDLQTEFADKDLIRSLRGEEIDGLMIDQETREIGVLLSKVAIEVEIEGIKRQKEEVELLPLPLEEQLATAKLAAARRKLDVIPYILAALAAQSAVLDTEAAVIMPAREEKANYDKQVSDLTTAEILPLMEAKATATAALTVEQAELLVPTIEKAEKTLALTTKRAELLEPMTEKAAVMSALTVKQGELLAPSLEKAAATEALTAAESGLLDPMNRKANKTSTLTAKQTELLEPMTRKATKTMSLTDKQAELLDPMTRKASATEALTAELMTLFGPMRLKAAASEELAAEMTAQLANHRLLATERVKLAEEKVIRLTEELVLMGKELTLDGKKITIERDRAALELQRAEARLAIVDALRIQLGEISTAMSAESAAEIVYITTQGSNEVAVKKSYIEKVEAAKYAAQASELASQTSALIQMAQADRNHSITMANKTANANITEKLIHLLA
jgi:hypothetical protein